MRRDLQRTMYELRGRFLAQRITLSACAALWVVLAFWLLWGGGLRAAGGWFGRAWTPGNALRRALVAAGFAVYYIRILFTQFVFLKRGVGWSEAATIASWLLVIDVVLAILGGTNARPLDAAGIAGIVLYSAGSWLNTYSEYLRYRWKSRPENRGRLYTAGLFRDARHMNYGGDLALFTGFALLTGSPVALIIPVVMLALFVFVNVPVLDAHLREKYGAEFDAYAARTSKLIPFLY